MRVLRGGASYSNNTKTSRSVEAGRKSVMKVADELALTGNTGLGICVRERLTNTNNSVSFAKTPNFY